MPKKKVKPYVAFDWQELRNQSLPGMPVQRTRDSVIRKAFKQYAEGNSWFEELSSVELNGEYETFKMGWIISNMFNS